MESTKQLEKDAGFMDKYSRQIGAFGLETMAKLVKLKVLIVGLQGVGMECAKNLILAGPGHITLYDDTPTEIKDLGSNFFLSEQDVGEPRSTAVAHKLAELNKMVTVSVHHGPLSESIVGDHHIVVFSNTKRSELIRWNSFCRSQSPAIGFILCDIRGAMGYTFTDYGNQFMIHDATGEAPITRIITDITVDDEGAIISLLGPDEDGKMHEMPDSDHDGWIEISEVEGIERIDDEEVNINTLGPYRISFMTKKMFRNGKDVDVFDPYRLRIKGSFQSFTPYRTGGLMTQHKKPFSSVFYSLEQCLVNPVYPGDYGLMFTDGSKFGRGEQLHLAVWSLLQFEELYGHLPKPHDKNDIETVLEIAKKGISSLSEATASTTPFQLETLDEDVIKLSAQYAAIELQPMAAFFGGIVAQEIVKMTGKFTPLKQWLHFDAFEVLPDESNDLNTTPQGCRYDHMIQMFGNEFLNQLHQLRLFLVGCGALGCEYLKNFALVGIACGSKGCITVTDNDRIEISNLNRQFLFREHNVGQSKSIAASNAVLSMNPMLNVNAMEQLVAPHTETTHFNDAFWMDLDLVTNALDNIKARVYVDQKCVFYKLPLLESGTLGTKCNVQVILPHQTQSYADGPQDAPEDQIPMCTLRNFPSLIEHCIEWSRAQFEDLFVVPMMEAKKFLSNRDFYLESIYQTTINHPNPKIGQASIPLELERVHRLLETLTHNREITFQTCVHMALKLFYSNFRDRILQLIHNFPENHVSKSGEPFWSGAKRFPQSVEAFDASNDLHIEFIRATANLFAVAYGIQPLPEQEMVPLDSEWRDPSTFQHLGSSFVAPEWKPSNEKIASDPEELKKQETERAASVSDSDRNELIQVLETLKTINIDKMVLEPADFEKDQDLNFHIDFIYASSNLRAFNYKIKQASRHKCKMIAGKIIPAIATTTASVTGLAMLELLKIVQGKKVSSFKDSSNSLGLNMYLMQEPAPPIKAKDEYDVVEMSMVKCLPSGFTKWDVTKIEIDATATLEMFLKVFKEQTTLNCDLLFHRVAETGHSKEDVRFGQVSGLMLYDRNAFGKVLKGLYEEKLNESLKPWIEERYLGLVDCSRRFIELQVSCSDDEDNVYRIPTVVCTFV